MTTSIDGFSAQRIRPVVVDVQPLNEQSSTPTRSQDVSPKVEAPVDAQRVAEATRKVEALFQTVRRSLQFKDDPTSGRMVVSVIDAESGEVIRQIPPEQMLRMAANLEQLNGLLLGERA
jgi:flagellar protein FlaG